MNTLLEAIQKHPEAFIVTCTARAKTTPSAQNKSNHLLLSEAIKSQQWEKVHSIITLANYQQALDGVVYCLSHYSYLDGEEWHKIVDLFNGDKLV